MSFRGYKRSIKLEFDYNEVKAGVPNVRKQMAILNAEFKASSAEATASGKAVDALGVKFDFLKNKISILKKEVEQHKEKLDQAKAAYGDNTKAVQNNTTNLQIAEAKLKEARAELDAVTKELDKQKTILGKTSEEWKTFGDKATEIGKDLTTKVTLPVLAAAAASFKLGADLEDAMGKARAVFKGFSQDMEAWSERAFTNFGLAKTTALDMANAFGALASGMGINTQQTVDYSKALTQLSVDMVAFHGGKLEVAQTALTSIFTGETEALKKYGIVMTQANLQQFAHSKGIREKISEMTEAEKVQLRYDFVMDRSRDVIGHYSKEQDNATTQLLKFQEGLKKLGESFSEQILPMFLPFIEFTNNMIEKFSNLSDGTKTLIVTIGGIAAVIGPVILAIVGLFKAISIVNDGMKAAKGLMDVVSGAGKAFNTLLDSTRFLGFLKWAGIIAGVAVALFAVVTAINFLIGKGGEMNSFIKNMSDMFGTVTNGIKETTSSFSTVTPNYVNGSHRNGLDFVPFDGYIAQLHKGERIVPAEENRKGSGDNYVFNLNVRMDEIDDVSKLVRVFDNFKQAKRAGVV